MNVKKYLKKPELLLYYLGMNGWFHRMPDETYLKMMYWAHFGKKLNLEDPQNFTEKLQWLKLHDRKPEYADMVDKCEVKNYVADRIGPEHIIPTLGVWDRFEDIDFNSLPDQFVLKCTHDSGGLVIVTDKQKLDIPSARKKLEKSLKRNYFYTGREWPYKNVKPRIIAEQYLSELNGLRDYKFYCFSGKMKLLLVVQGRGTPNPTGDHFDENGNPLDLISGSFLRSACPPELPATFEKMKRIAETLSAGMTHLRVDLYEVDGKIYFGELTFFDGSGFDRLQPEGWEQKLGDMLVLPVREQEKIRKDEM